MKRKSVLLLVIGFMFLGITIAYAQTNSTLSAIIQTSMKNLQTYYINMFNSNVDQIDKKYETAIQAYASKKATDTKSELNAYVTTETANLEKAMDDKFNNDKADIDQAFATELASAKAAISQVIQEKKNAQMLDMDKTFEEQIKLYFEVPAN